MNSEQLRAVHPEYAANISEWRFLSAANKGSKALVDFGVIRQHERESEDNYLSRKAEAFGFSYSKAVTALFVYYLFSKQIIRTLDALEADQQWQMFVKDCDLEGANLDQFFQAKMNQVIATGQYGILVDKSPIQYPSQAAEIDAKVYPYLAGYSAENVLDWSYDRDENGRPFLAYLKLREQSTYQDSVNPLTGYRKETSLYRLWWPDRWEIWEEADSETTDIGEAVLVAEGENVLGEIPFVWLYNAKSGTRGVGVSDITDISRIDVSIMRNLSQGEQVVDYSAFPMMRKPLSNFDEPDEIGPTSVLTYDPEFPESKPDWLLSPTKEPIDAILLWIDKKVQEIYRMAGTGGIAATEVSTQAKSGVALKLELRTLGALLVNKAQNIVEVQEQIVRLWLKWQKMEHLYADVKIEAPADFDVEALSADLENMLVAKSLVGSDVFSKAVSKRMARVAMPNLGSEELAEIDDDIDTEPVIPEYEPPEDE